MPRIWLFKDRRVRRSRDGKAYKKTVLCIQRDDLILVGDTVHCGQQRAYLDPMQRQMLAILMYAPGFVEVKDLVDLIYPNPFDCPDSPDRVIRVVVYKLRRAMKHVDWELRSQLGRGYELVKYEPHKVRPPTTKHP